LPPRFGGTHIWDVSHTCNSLLGGLVGITAGCSVTTANHAILIGTISAFVYHFASCTMRKFKIDDPLDAFAVHGACGLWGVIAVGLFTVREYSYAPAEGSAARLAEDGTDLGPDAGIFMPGARGTLFLTQLVVPLFEILWVVVTSSVLFGLLKLFGIFRVPVEEEELGMDVSKHGGSAYAVTSPSNQPTTPTPNQMKSMCTA